MVSDLTMAVLYVGLMIWVCDAIRLMLRAWLHLSEEFASKILRYVLIGIFTLRLLQFLDDWLQGESQIEQATTEVLLNSEEGEGTPTAHSE